MSELNSQKYVQHVSRGPFPDRIDPWAEAARYFQQIHSGIIDHILVQIQEPLLVKGYYAGKETSLQIMGGREPDLYILGKPTSASGEKSQGWDYAAAAEAVKAEPGLLAAPPELEMIFIRRVQPSELVAVIEIVSPSNKTKDDEIESYRGRRTHLLLGQAVNVVEIDLTCSIKHLFDHAHTAYYPYHTTVFIAHQLPHVVVSNFGEAMKRIAVPLRGDAIGVDVQDAYTAAYQRAVIALHINEAEDYTEGHLPFPSLLTASQRQTILASAQAWQTRLAELRKPADG
jgi:uncharacterized protein DUF4058